MSDLAPIREDTPGDPEHVNPASPHEKPPVASGYVPEMLELVRQTCLYVATILGDLLEEHVTVVGGLVPYLLVRQDAITSSADRHIGTRDLDLGFAVSVLDDERYEIIAERLRKADFQPDENNRHRPTRQRWRIRPGSGISVAVDFLIPPIADERPGSPFSLEDDLAATVTPGIELAFRDREIVPIEGYTIRGEWARRRIPVCGPGAFVVLKALAFRRRGERKDAYDLYYVLRYYGEDVADVADRLGPLLDSPVTREALDFLRQDFIRTDAVGPKRIAEFMEVADPEALQADAYAFVTALLDRAGFTGAITEGASSDGE